MRKFWLITAVCLIVVGLALFAIVMTINHWDFSKLNTEHYETNTIEITDDFDNISISTDTADLRFALSEDEICRVVCVEHPNAKHAASIQGDTLTVTEEDHRKWYEHIGFNLDSCEITVYLPKTQYTSLSVKESTGDVEIPGEFSFETAQIVLTTGDIRFYASTAKDANLKTTTGEILVKNLTADSLDLSCTTGDITVSDVTVVNDVSTKTFTGDVSIKSCTCMNLISDGTTGGLTLNDVIVAERLKATRSTGDVKLTSSDASEIYIETSTGDVTGSLLSEKVFFTETDTGDVNVPKSMSGGRCEITTSTGDIHFTQ